MKKLLQVKLKWLAKMVLARYHPQTVGITGSVGKTSAKEAIYTVLAKKHSVRRNAKNYNNEIGVPLTIIGVDSPGRSLFGWAGVFWRAVRLILFKDRNYPKILILEMGVDRPGDMAYLNSIVKCDIGVVTLIGSSHLEYFGTVDRIQKEKSGLIKNLRAGGWAILNYDNEKARQISQQSQARVMTYGFDDKAAITAQKVFFSFEDRRQGGGLAGISFKLGYNGSYVPVFLPKVVGRTSVYAALAAASVGLACGMNLVEIAEALKELDSPKGRMNLIPGIKRTLIIDDTYNSSPQSAIAALEVVKMLPLPTGGKKYAILGDMLELGSFSEEGHRQVGRQVVAAGIDRLLVVGERARDIARGAAAAGMKEDDIFHFPDPAMAGLFIEERLKENDLVFAKGSQGMRLEKLVKEIMAEPLRAPELLVRQEKQWLER
ncbi:MAG: UDP-N-acetylmuramoyl-tripeptide--D-alanyl-D-alanine ligase [Planctomycetes bacterium]|jgi:UDP-N-acetylmuramoyl-tripeptide--D-alanyl-D-alanine ligase|nr:UDP-N-acetylmuramoyl-tripeptide--D-alanyl-D-alanine ligase [Planctomycetota bacterium]